MIDAVQVDCLIPSLVRNSHSVNMVERSVCVHCGHNSWAWLLCLRNEPLPLRLGRLDTSFGHVQMVECPVCQRAVMGIMVSYTQHGEIRRSVVLWILVNMVYLDANSFRMTDAAHPCISTKNRPTDTRRDSLSRVISHASSSCETLWLLTGG